MGITNSNKQIDTTQISCDGSLKITLVLAAAPDIASNPTDIVLVLDRSGSMAGSPLSNMKAGADTFIDIIDEARTEPLVPADTSALSALRKLLRKTRR